VDVLVASHHGSRTFFKEDEDEPYVEAIAAISPDYTLISVGKDNDYDHPHEDALKLYQEYTGGAVAQTTIEGSILVKVDDGEVALEPSPVDEQVEEEKVAAKSTSLSLATVPSISLSAKQYNSDTKQPFRPLKNGVSRVPKDEYILFTANISNRSAGTYLRWEVKNLGVDEDAGHSEHYEKSEPVARRYDYRMNRTDAEHEWTRRTAYTGRHECIVSLVDRFTGRVLAGDRFVVPIGKARSRYLRRLGRSRR
jgi:Adenylyl/Guanylyl and SMODS C-terminal sensor domain